MTVFIQCIEPRNTPYEGVQWTEAGQVLELEDDVAQDLLRIEGFSEVHPDAVPGRHALDEAPEAPEAGDENDEPPAKPARGRKTPVTE